MTILKRIQQKILDRAYYLSSHAEEEMLDDALERQDIEHAILKGRIDKTMTKDIRDTRYRVEGPARNGQGFACRVLIERRCEPHDHYSLCVRGEFDDV